jgi:hypothetical protein
MDQNLTKVWEPIPLPCFLPKACFGNEALSFIHSQNVLFEGKNFTNHDFFFLQTQNLGIVFSKSAFCLPNGIPNRHDS